SFSGDYWAHTIATLTGQGYRVVVPDQIGFGKSSKPDIRYHFDLLARNTKMLLDSLGVTRAAIVGHSFGGMLSVYFARDYPEMTAVPLPSEAAPCAEPGMASSRDSIPSRA